MQPVDGLSSGFPQIFAVFDQGTRAGDRTSMVAVLSRAAVSAAMPKELLP